MDDPTFAEIRHCLRSPNAWTRRGAIDTLIADEDEQRPATRAEDRDRAPRADPETLGMLLDHLERDFVPANRLAIIEHLGRRQYAPARDRLARLARDPAVERSIAEAAGEALAKIDLAGSSADP